MRFFKIKTELTEPYKQDWLSPCKTLVMKPPHKWAHVTKAGKGASLRQSRRLRKGKAISGVIAEGCIIQINCNSFLKLEGEPEKLLKEVLFTVNNTQQTKT